MSISVKPGVFENLIDCEALSWILLEHAIDQVFTLLGDLAEERDGLEVELLGANASFTLFAVVIPEGKLGREKNACESTDTPDITAKAVFVSLENFWSEVSWCTDLE